MGAASIHALLAAAAVVAARCAVVPGADEPTDLIRSIVADTERKSDSERNLNECFAEAYSAMGKGGCRALDEAGKRRLSIYFANCHLEVTGRKTYPCHPSKELRECTGDMDQVAYAEFSAYTRHVDVLCYTIESKLWRQETALLIDRLLHGANDTAMVLSQVVTTSEDLRRQHEQALLESAKAHNLSAALVQDVVSVKDGLHAYTENVQRTIEETQSSYGLVADMLRQLAGYTQVMLSVSGVLARNLLYVQSGAFYAGAGTLAWGLSSGPRTGHTRPWLYLALVACLVGELLIITHWSAISVAAASLDPGHFNLTQQQQRLMAASAGEAAAAGLPSPGTPGGGPHSAPVRSWSLWGASVTTSALTWVGSAHRVVLDPLLIRLSWERSSVEAWDASNACWGLRFLYCAYALGTVLHAVLSWTDYTRKSYVLLTQLQAEVDRMARASAAGGEGGAVPVAPYVPTLPPPHPAALLSGSHAAAVQAQALTVDAAPTQYQPVVLVRRHTRAAAATSSFLADDALVDPDWSPCDPDDLGRLGNAYGAMAAAGGRLLRTRAVAAAAAPSASAGATGGGAGEVVVTRGLLLGSGAGAATLGQLPRGSSGGSSYSATFGAGTGLLGALGSGVGGAASSSAAITLYGVGSGVSSTHDGVGGEDEGEGGRHYPFRARELVTRPNPVCAFEAPESFEQLLHMQWLASLTARVAQAPALADDAAAADGSESEGDEDDGTALGHASSGAGRRTMPVDDGDDGGIADGWSVTDDGVYAEGDGDDHDTDADGGGGVGGIVEEDMGEGHRDHDGSVLPVGGGERHGLSSSVATGSATPLGIAIGVSSRKTRQSALTTPMVEPLDGDALFDGGDFVSPATSTEKRLTGAKRRRTTGFSTAAAAAAVLADELESPPPPTKVRRKSSGTPAASVAT